MNVQSYRDNNILKTDSYKLTHWKQMVPGTTELDSYMEARSALMFPTSVFVGLQPYLHKLKGRIITQEKIDQADAFAKAHFGGDHFNRKGWEALLRKYDGYLPIKIRAVKEGTEVPVGNILFAIEVTDKTNDFPWLGQWAETLLMKTWYTTTVATNSFYARRIIKKYLDETSDNPDHLMFALHDFGYRGVSSEETAELGGLSHLVSFYGTDTLAAIIAANDFYNNSEEFKMFGFSIPASEHSTATPWGRGDGELKYIANMLLQYPTGAFSMVADSYNTMEFARKAGKKFGKQILARDGRVVFRPDSGDPVDINVELIQILAEEFGYTVNSKGYKVLPTQVRVIQGDGIDLQMIEKILAAFKELGFAADNIVFGSGGGLLQKFNRDDLGFAIKCNHATINGESVNVQKDPFTSKSKKSKTGDLKLIKENGKFRTVSSTEMSREEFDALHDELVPVFENGIILVNYDFEEVRATANSYL